MQLERFREEFCGLELSKLSLCVELDILLQRCASIGGLVT